MRILPLRSFHYCYQQILFCYFFHFDPSLLNYSLKLLLILIFIGWYFFCKYYFLKNKYYLKVFERYERIDDNQKLAIIGIVYSLVTFISFISIASLLSESK